MWPQAAKVIRDSSRSISGTNFLFYISLNLIGYAIKLFGANSTWACSILFVFCLHQGLFGIWSVWANRSRLVSVNRKGTFGFIPDFPWGMAGKFSIWEYLWDEASRQRSLSDNAYPPGSKCCNTASEVKQLRIKQKICNEDKVKLQIIETWRTVIVDSFSEVDEKDWWKDPTAIMVNGVQMIRIEAYLRRNDEEKRKICITNGKCLSRHNNRLTRGHYIISDCGVGRSPSAIIAPRVDTTLQNKPSVTSNKPKIRSNATINRSTWRHHPWMT